MKPARRICVFCGSNQGNRTVFRETAAALGRELVARGYGLVYGGGNVGLMNVIANTVLAAGGVATGVIPSALVDKEVAHRGLTELRVVAS
ncbi:MAG TPA: TIGR00730 family Rossman fold protein, partial [Candidatus Binatia bacterium]|nr:TIGR00730 family Rossman fold protein [Candidatus Binatia bacterium]